MQSEKFGLLVDLSSPVGTFSLFKDQNPLICFPEKELQGKNAHSESFLAELDVSLKELNYAPHLLSSLIVASGPGSFTGLRIAYATLKAFAWSNHTPLITLEGPEARALAFQKERRTSTSSLAVLTYLTADKYVCSRFRLLGDRVEKISEEISSTALAGDRGQFWVLTESRISQQFLGAHPDNTTVFPLRSSHLIHFKQAATRKEIPRNELFSLSPLYFGSAHFD